MAFATVQDLIDRWKPLDQEKHTQAELLLEDASLLIKARLPRPVDETDTDLMALLKAVTVSMVKRAMAAGGLDAPVSSQMMVAGSYTQQLTYSNPAGDLYLTSAERKALGIGSGRVGSIRPVIGRGSYEG